MSSDHRIAAGRATLAVEVVGRGDPIVFLHAAICDSRMWRAQLDGVGANNKAIAYDRRGFGETRAEKEDFSAVADLMAVIDATANGTPAILVGCSEGGRIALDAALRHPSHVRALFLISPSVSGAPEAIYPPEIKGLMAQLKDAQEVGDLDRVNAIKARLFLDGPLAPEGRVVGEARRLFLEMNGIALRSPPIGANLDVAPAFPRLGEIAAPSLVICGDLEFPHIQERSRHIATTMSNGSFRALTGAAHVASLVRPTEVTGLLVEFIDRCSGRLPKMKRGPPESLA
ncbi:MAG TPA: alpha/beta hydrolase [Stellaceae bacterium]|nr:alpha/beta hydrolase [Stellaceae bacterium]